MGRGRLPFGILEWLGASAWKVVASQHCASSAVTTAYQHHHQRLLPLISVTSSGDYRSSASPSAATTARERFQLQRSFNFSGHYRSSAVPSAVMFGCRAAIFCSARPISCLEFGSHEDSGPPPPGSESRYSWACLRSCLGCVAPRPWAGDVVRSEGGGGDTYDVPSGFHCPRTKAPSKKHVPVYTCVLQSLGDVDDDWSVGVMLCKRFKRWLSPLAHRKLLAKTGCKPGMESE